MAIQKVELADGSTRWRIRVYVGTVEQANGTTKRKYLTRTYDRKRDADAEHRRLSARKEAGGLIVPSRETLAKYVTRWLDNVKSVEVRARTLHDYRQQAQAFVVEPPDGCPDIGSIRLDRLSRAAVQEWITWLSQERGLAPRSVRIAYGILRQCLGYAVRQGDLAANPADGATLPKMTESGARPKRKANPLDKAETERFLAKASDDRLSALWHVLLFGGLRPGEAFGLKWADVDLEAGRVQIRRALVRVGAPGWRLEEPKTSQARRTVELPDLAMRPLREWSTEQKRERMKAGSEYADDGFVFATHFGHPLDHSTVRRQFEALLEAAKVERRRLYDLRHTCATLLLLAGVPVKIVSERLGHRDIALTLNTYTHVLPGMQERAAARFDEMFG